jgi:hypothetical protein
MIRKYLIPLLIVLLFLSLVGCSTTTTTVKPETDVNTAESKAVAAAKEWLSLVDNQKYGESWQQAAQLFKDAVNKQQWIQIIQSGRRPLGKNTSRELKSKRYMTNVPGAPDGEYVVIEFNASFENKKSAIETVTPMLDKDAKWRVSGYFIR